MTRPSTTLSILARSFGLILAASGAGCLACNEPGCPGGFSLRLEAADPEGFSAGAHRFEITVEDSLFEVRCVFTENNETSVCEPALRREGKSRADVDLSIGSRPDPDRPDPVGHVFISIVDTSKSDGAFKAYRGPEYVAVRVEHEGVELGTVEYTPQYDRTEHRGSPECGYCDESEEFVDEV